MAERIHRRPMRPRYVAPTATEGQAAAQPAVPASALPPVAQLQGMAGNRAVGSLLAQRQGLDYSGALGDPGFGGGGGGGLPGLGDPGFGGGGGGGGGALPGLGDYPGLGGTPETGGGAGEFTTLRFGSRGPQVVDLQEKLNRVDPESPLEPDGIFGSKTSASVKKFQGEHGLDIDGIVGMLTWPILNSEAEGAPPEHATLFMGSSGAEVGLAQQKLNACGAAVPRLPIDALFGPGTLAAVINFQVTFMGALPTGTLDRSTWAALERAAPGGGTQTEGGKPVEQHVESGGGSSVAVAEGSIHPVVGGPNGVTSGEAVEELQQKLNGWRAANNLAPPLVEDAVFKPIDSGAINLYQAMKGLPTTGIGDGKTWNALDVDVPGTSVGVVKRAWHEEVGGNPNIGMTSNYSWRISGDEMRVIAKVNFTANMPSPAWFAYVQSTWNKFDAWNVETGERLHINFEMQMGTGSDAAVVEVVAPPEKGRANAGKWYLADDDATNTIPHEFGHLIGLRDEYQQHPGDYVTVTGHEPPVGDATGPPGVTPFEVAHDLQMAMLTRDSMAAKKATYDRGMKQGAFAQRVVQAYAALPLIWLPPTNAPRPLPQIGLTGELVRDLHRAFPEPPEFDGKYEAIETLTYTSSSIMGAPGWNKIDPHDHGVRPRHIQEFVDAIARFKPGAWVGVDRS